MLIVLSMQLWNDYQLRWEPSHYGKIEVIRVPAENVWKPDIVLFNKSVTFDLALLFCLLCRGYEMSHESHISALRVSWDFSYESRVNSLC